MERTRLADEVQPFGERRTYDDYFVGPLIWWLASSSIARTMAEWSDFERPLAAQALNSSWHVAVFGNATPSAFAF
jgi:hypothetical protein